jgi:hypothetical protein
MQKLIKRPSYLRYFFMREKIKTFAIGALVLLSACDPSWGPHALEMEVSEGFTLVDRKKQNFDFASDSIHHLQAYYSGSKKTLTLTRVGLSDQKQNFDFKKVTFNKEDNGITSDPATTGQNAGIEIKRTLVCNPECESVAEQEVTRSCTYYETRERTRCHGRGHDRECNTYWESYPVSGLQRVRETTTVRSYNLSGRIFQSHWTMAVANGSYRDTNVSSVSLTSCR